jgi:WD40 repeat protein
MTSGTGSRSPRVGVSLRAPRGGAELRICQTEPFEFVRAIPQPERPITSLSFDAAGERLIGGCEDGIVRVWEVASGREIARLVGHDLGVLCAQFSPDGRRIATGGRDGTIRIWSGQTYEQYSILTGHEKYVYALVWSKDGERLYSTSGDGTARVWECSPPRDRIRAGEERAEIVARLTPLVAAWLSAPGGRSFDELARDWSDRVRLVARQVILGRALGTDGP